MPVIVDLLASNPYFDAILAIALGICIGGIMHSLSSYIAKVPWVGGPIANAVDGMAQVITNAAGHILAPISQAIGGTLHQVSRLVDWTYSQFRSHAKLLFGIAAFLPPLAIAIQSVRGLVNHFAASHAGQTARIKTLEREYKGIEHQVKQLEREFHGIDETGIRKQIHTINNELATINNDTIPHLRSRVAADEGAFAGLESWLGIKAGTDVKAWSIALATTLLGAVGLGNLRCSNFGNLLNKFGCGLGTLLNDLLGIVIAGLVLESVCEFLPFLEDAFGAVAGPITHLLTEVPLGDCEVVPDRWSALHVQAGPLPPAQTLGAFPT